MSARAAKATHEVWLLLAAGCAVLGVLLLVAAAARVIPPAPGVSVGLVSLLASLLVARGLRRGRRPAASRVAPTHE